MKINHFYREFHFNGKILEHQQNFKSHLFFTVVFPNMSKEYQGAKNTKNTKENSTLVLYQDTFIKNSYHSYMALL